MNRIFVDTGAWYALVDNRDPAHEKASAFFVHNTIPLITSNYVFDETVTLLRKKVGWQTAFDFGERVRSSERLQIMPILETDEQKGWTIFARYRDQDFSYTDCTSFAIMQRLKISTAFTFDHHFRVMRFNVVPSFQ